MRISGYGAGFGQQNQSRDRAAAFRARHSIGQRIKGRIIRREANGLHWVNAGGEELLARLEVNADPGDELIFIVRALTPEIMLQALPSGMSAADLPGLVQRFRAAREVFEVQDAEIFALLRPSAPQSQLRAQRFDEALAAHPDGAQRYAKVQELLSQINASLGERQAAVAMYQPWLLPGCRRLEMLRRPVAAGMETVLSAYCQDAGGIEARVTQSAGTLRLVLAVERPESSGTLQVELSALARDESGVEPELLGPTRLRPNALGGVLGELFGSVPTWSSGGLNTRV